MNPTIVSLKDARQQFSELIDRAALVRESFVVTKFDKPKAMIVPVPAQFMVKKGRRKLGVTALVGLWKDRTDIGDTTQWVSTRRKSESLRAFRARSS